MFLTRSQSRARIMPVCFFDGRRTVSRYTCPALVMATIWLLSACSGDVRFGFGVGDRVAFVGNSLAERMQHDGWLEVYLQAVHPDHRILFRNLGYSGDQVHYRARAHEGFGDSDTHLRNMKANVIFAFFGYNESFSNNPPAFKEQLTAWINHIHSQQYDGVSTPRLVLFSPIAHEDLGDPNLPDGAENNKRLAAYTQAMKEIAEARGIPFVDLFSATQKAYQEYDEPLTINGIHLNERGNEFVARYFVEEVLGKRIREKPERLEALRQAVLEKNDCWFRRYRTVSGNDVWGSRSVQDGNRATLQREMEMLNVMTANRDARIWSLLKGEDLPVDDSNVPEPVKVGTHITRKVEYIGPKEAIKRMTVPSDLEVNLFASEREFPEIVNPVALQVDTRGRIWVASWGNYPMREPLSPLNDRLVVLTDADNDGVADKATTFAYVANPTGFEFWNDGVVVVSAPYILYLKDTTGDDVADVQIRLFGGIGADDTHHTANNLIYAPDGNIYYQRGIFILENIETPWRWSEESGTPGLYRFNPRTFDFSFVVENGPNAHGISLDKWGNLLITDGTSGKPYQVYLKRTVTSRSDVSRFETRPLFPPEVRPVTATTFLSSAHFPEHYQNSLLIYNVIGYQGIKQYSIQYEDGGNIKAAPGKNFLFTGTDPRFAPNSEATPRVLPADYKGDPNFRPTDGVIGFDGALYFSDWQNAVITHSPYNLRDASRDRAHGRIYRVTAKGRPLQTPVSIKGEPVEKLLELLRHPVDGVRHQVRVELSGRPTREVIEKTQQWAERLDVNKKEDALPLLEALWVHQQHNVKNRELLVKVLRCREEQARIAAQKVAWEWSDRNTHLRGDSTTTPRGMDHKLAYEKFWHPDTAAHLALASNKEVVTASKKGGSDMDLSKAAVAQLEIGASQLQFDVTDFTVKAGQRVRLTLNNHDVMQHNLLIVAPGAADEVARRAIDLGKQGPEKHFVPDSDKVLHATRLLGANAKETLEFIAPETPGNYPFVCTFPGHAPVMKGMMKVIR